jgi:cardiolipin synthase
VARRRSRRGPPASAALLIIVAAAVVVALSHHTAGTAATATGAQSAPTPTPKPSASKARKAKASGASATSAAAAARSRATAGALSLLVEPDAGLAPVYTLLRSARHRLDIEIYELEDDQATAILAADARRGVRVRVVLNAHYVGHYNQPAFTYLRAHGVAVRWAPPQFAVTHDKAIVVDGRAAVVMTMNLTARYYSTSREFVVVDHRRADVAAIAASFANDWAGGGLPPSSPAALVWSPGAQDALVALIASARHQVLAENEEMNDAAVTGALQAAARRGVRIEVVMTRQSEWAGAFSTLARAGVAVRTYAYTAPLYIHAKAIVVDPGSRRARAFVGSQNFSVASLLYDRELGLITSQAALVDRVAAVIRRDGAGGSAWRP